MTCSGCFAADLWCVYNVFTFLSERVEIENLETTYITAHAVGFLRDWCECSSGVWIASVERAWMKSSYKCFGEEWCDVTENSVELLCT